MGTGPFLGIGGCNLAVLNAQTMDIRDVYVWEFIITRRVFFDVRFITYQRVDTRNNDI